MSCCLHLWAAVLLCADPASSSSAPHHDAASVHINWQDDYATATRLAEAEGKMLVLYFRDGTKTSLCGKLENEVLNDPLIAARLATCVCARLSVEATSLSTGKPARLLEHPAFQEMLGQPGIATIDYAHRDAQYYGLVVGAFPMLGDRPYSPFEMSVILDLPPGTLTQRTLIYAVRTHPERPASTSGELNTYLANEAESHSDYQARMRLQGHHNWDSRFQRINRRLPFGLLASEVCAESWPGQGLLQAAIECVRSWRLSSGHWSAVRAPQQFYAYDMKRGSNGVWYATGIFGRR